MGSLFSSRGLTSGAHCESTGLTHRTASAFPELGRSGHFEHRSGGPSGTEVVGAACGWARKQAGGAAGRFAVPQTRMAPVQVLTLFDSETILKVGPVGFPKILDMQCV